MHSGTQAPCTHAILCTCRVPAACPPGYGQEWQEHDSKTCAVHFPLCLQHPMNSASISCQKHCMCALVSHQPKNTLKSNANQVRSCRTACSSQKQQHAERRPVSHTLCKAAWSLLAVAKLCTPQPPKQHAPHNTTYSMLLLEPHAACMNGTSQLGPQKGHVSSRRLLLLTLPDTPITQHSHKTTASRQ